MENWKWVRDPHRVSVTDQPQFHFRFPISHFRRVNNRLSFVENCCVIHIRMLSLCS